MLILVTGGSGSGKSAYAESRIMELKEAKQLPVYYLATMQVYGSDEEKIVNRHLKLREGKGFKTLEQPQDIEYCSDVLPKGSIILLEDISNLVANEMFREEEIIDEDEVVEKICRGVMKLYENTEDMVMVAGNVFEDGMDYSETTRSYIRAMARVNNFLASEADEAYESVAGIPVRLK